jgi:serine acetyltransferase
MCEIADKIICKAKEIHSRLRNRPRIEHNRLTRWNWMVSHPEKLSLGHNVDIGAFTYIQAENGIVIGDNVKIGGGTHIYSKNSIDGTGGQIIICKNTCIGANSVILPKKDGTPLVIGFGAKIGAMSLIRENVSSFSVIYGIQHNKFNKIGCDECV